MTDVPNASGPDDGSLNEPAPASPPTPQQADAPATPEPDTPSMDAIDREVEAAMASMDQGDLAELCGPTPGMPSSVGTPARAANRGDKLTGTVAGVSDDEIFIEFDAKSQGALPKAEFKEGELPEVGQQIDVVMDRFDEQAGLMVIYREGAIRKAAWETLEVGQTVQGRVTGLIKGGLEVNLNGIRGFMPASQTDLIPMKDISVLLNEVVQVQVMELNKRGKNILVSRRKFMEQKREADRDEVLADLAVGQTRHGVVSNIMDFGAFVDIGGVDGLVHIRDLSWGNVEKVTDVLSQGQEVDVQVLKVDKKRNRISLGLKQALPNPWVGVEDRFPSGTSLKARVVRLADFGAFAELEPGIEALIPISEMGWSRVKHPSDVVSVGEMVDAVVIRVEADKERIAVSMKQAQADPWGGVLETFEAQSLVTGKVTRLADFGAFVELAPGVEGLIHISEMADRRINTCSEVVQPGQEIETRVLGVDQENRRISLSIKAVNAPEASAAEPPAHAEPLKPKKRKKPLRGGLSSHFEW